MNVGAAVMLTAMALASAGFGQSPLLTSLAGLFQRIGIITGFTQRRTLPSTRHAA